VTSPLLPLAIALGAAAADGAGAHHAAFYLVLLAIPAAAAAALAAAGELAEGRQVVLRIVCTAAALGLLVLSSAARANAPVGGGVPAIAFSALLAALGSYGLLGVAWLARPRLFADPISVPKPTT
jgi:hypothetical protein